MDSSLNCILLFDLNINDNNISIINVDLIQILINENISSFGFLSVLQ